MTEHHLLLALDTATRPPTLALAEPDGDVVGESQWESQHRHGEELLQRLTTCWPTPRPSRAIWRA